MRYRSRVVLSVSLFANGLFLGMFLMGFKGPNVLTSFNPDVDRPTIAKSAFVHEIGSVIGAVTIGERVYVAPTASVRGDEGQPIYIGNESNVQDSVVVHGLETQEGKEVIAKNLVEVGGKKYSVYIGDRVSMAHQSQVHGPARVGNDAFIGMQALVFKAEVGSGTVVEPGAKVIGVTIGDKRIVPAGTVLTKQADADALAAITDAYPFKDLNKAVVHVNTQFADGYNGKKPAAH
jgi:carbonic anhydrase/acetyltransferase-like protein (isoleucine patch superfamily)